MATIHASELNRELTRIERAKTTDVYDLYVATLGSVAVAHYRGQIVGKAPNQRYRIKLKDSGQIRTFAFCLVMEWEGKEVIW